MTFLLDFGRGLTVKLYLYLEIKDFIMLLLYSSPSSRLGKGIKKSGSTSITIGFVIQAKNDPIWPFFQQWRNSFRTHEGVVEVSE